jgi:hypothetical protein
MDHNNPSLTLQSWISNSEVDTLVDVASHVSLNISKTSLLLETSTHILFPPISSTKHIVEANKKTKKNLNVGIKKQLHGMKK